MAAEGDILRVSVPSTRTQLMAGATVLGAAAPASNLKKRQAVTRFRKRCPIGCAGHGVVWHRLSGAKEAALQHPLAFSGRGEWFWVRKTKERRIAMHVEVHSRLCCGYALCADIAPAIFTINPGGKAESLAGAIPGDLEEAARTAARECPGSAITIHDSGLL